MQHIEETKKNVLLTDATTKTEKQDLARIIRFLEHKQASGLILDYFSQYFFPFLSASELYSGFFCLEIQTHIS